MKFRILTISLLLLTLCSCIKEKVAVTGITLNTEGITLEIGQTQQLIARVSPSGADNQVILWKTKDSQVATVSAEGVVTAVAPGETEIHALSDDNTTIEAVCKIRVPEVFIPVTSISLDKQELPLIKGGSDNLSVTLEPENASDKEVRWASSNEKVVTVSQEGAVTAVSTGEAVIVVTSHNGGFTASCRVVVDQPVGGITLSETSLKLDKNQQALLTYKITPEDAIDKGVSWESSNPDVATVVSGIVTAKSVGTATITVKTLEGNLGAECSVEVVSPVSGVILKDHTVSMIVGTTRVLEAVVMPEDAENKTVTWSSSDPSVAEVAIDPTGSGVVTAKKYGQAEITVTTEDGSCKDVCQVAVDYEVQSVSVEPNMITLFAGQTVTLKPVITPSGASNKNVSWKSSDASVAEVSAEGVVTANKFGQAEITVTTEEGGRTAVCKVSVDYEVQSVSVEPNMITLFTGETVTLKPVITPSDASNQNVSWKSSDASIAEVSAGGVVTAKVPGNAEITVTTDDGGRTAVCKVTVETPVSGITLDKPELIMFVDDEATITATVSPSGATHPEISWSSTDENVATVVDGKVKAVGAGQATICATTVDNGKHAFCKVTVRKKVESVTVTPATKELFVGETLLLSAEIAPEEVKDLGVVWSVEGSAVTVSQSGLVTAVAKGEATVKATVKGGDEFGFATIVVKKPVTAVSVTPDKFEMYIGDQPKTLTVKLTPEDASDLTYVVKNSKPEVATVNAEGTLVTPVSVGNTIITYTPNLPSGKLVMKTVNVEVRAHVSGINIIQGATASVTVGKTLKLKADPSPTDAYNAGVKWSTSNSAVATVAQDGTVSGVKVGTAVITATATEDGKETSYKSSCTVTVEKIAITGITISQSSLSLTVGGTSKLTAAIQPSNAYDTDVVWSSSKESVAKVSQTGEVTAVAAGTATITVKSMAEPDKFSKTCEVTVKAQEVHVEGITISPTSLSLTPGQSKYLTVEYSPSNVSAQFLGHTWSSGNDAIAKVDQTGKVTGVASGTTTISVTTTDGNKSDQIPVTVTVPVTGVTISKTSANMAGNKTLDLTASVLPATATNQEIEWSSSNENLATVTQTGKVTSKNTSGEVIITAAAKEDKTKKATCTINIIADAKQLSSITVNYPGTVYAQETLTATITVTPADATLESIEWRPAQGSPFAVAPLGELPLEANIIGQISTATQGNLEVSVTDVFGNKKTKYAIINVKQNPAASVDLNKTEVVLKVGETFTLVPTIAGTDPAHPATVSSTGWSVTPTASTGPVSVSSAGVVTAKKTGTATVKVTVMSPGMTTGKTATCNVTVISTDPGSGGNQGVDFDDWNF